MCFLSRKRDVRTVYWWLNFSRSWSKGVNQDIKYIKDSKLNITDEGGIQDFLGENIDRKPDSTIHINQPHIIDPIKDDLNMVEKTRPKDTPD